MGRVEKVVQEFFCVQQVSNYMFSSCPELQIISNRYYHIIYAPLHFILDASVNTFGKSVSFQVSKNGTYSAPI